MTWEDLVCSEHPTANIEACCDECVEIFCEMCGTWPDSIARYADDDEEGKYPLEIVKR